MSDLSGKIRSDQGKIEEIFNTYFSSIIAIEEPSNYLSVFVPRTTSKLVKVNFDPNKIKSLIDKLNQFEVIGINGIDPYVQKSCSKCPTGLSFISDWSEVKSRPQSIDPKTRKPVFTLLRGNTFF